MVFEVHKKVFHRPSEKSKNGPDAGRTRDFQSAILVLSHLSYRPKIKALGDRSSVEAKKPLAQPELLPAVLPPPGLMWAAYGDYPAAAPRHRYSTSKWCSLLNMCLKKSPLPTVRYHRLVESPSLVVADSSGSVNSDWFASLLVAFGSLSPLARHKTKLATRC